MLGQRSPVERAEGAGTGCADVDRRGWSWCRGGRERRRWTADVELRRPWRGLTGHRLSGRERSEQSVDHRALEHHLWSAAVAQADLEVTCPGSRRRAPVDLVELADVDVRHPHSATLALDRLDEHGPCPEPELGADPGPVTVETDLTRGRRVRLIDVHVPHPVLRPARVRPAQARSDPGAAPAWGVPRRPGGGRRAAARQGVRRTSRPRRSRPGSQPADRARSGPRSRSPASSSTWQEQTAAWGASEGCSSVDLRIRSWPRDSSCSGVAPTLPRRCRCRASVRCGGRAGSSVVRAGDS